MTVLHVFSQTYFFQFLFEYSYKNWKILTIVLLGKIMFLCHISRNSQESFLWLQIFFNRYKEYDYL